MPVICSSVFLCISVPTDKDHDMSASSVQLHEKANVSFKQRGSKYISHLYSDRYRPLLNSSAGSFPIGLCNRAAERYITGAAGVVAAEMAFLLQLPRE